MMVMLTDSTEPLLGFVAKMMNYVDVDDMGEVRFDVILCPSRSPTTSAGISTDYDEVVFVAEDLFP